MNTHAILHRRDCEEIHNNTLSMGCLFDAFGMFRRAPAPLALARGFALYDEDTSTHALHMHRCIQTHPHKTMRCELQSVVPDARALLHAAPCQCQCGSRNRLSGIAQGGKCSVRMRAL